MKWIKVISYSIFVSICLCWPSSVCCCQPLVKVTHNAFTAYYSLLHCTPTMVVYTLAPSDFVGNQKLKSRHFKVDTKLPPPRIKANALNGSGYVRGHLCAAGDRDTDKGLLKQTYLTSNMAPMTMVCNSGAWKNLEDTCRVLAQVHGSLTIVSGCVYPERPEDIKWIGRVAVPSQFYRVAICNVHQGEIWAWLCPNTLAASRPVRVGTKVLQQVIQFRNAANDYGGILPHIFAR